MWVFATGMVVAVFGLIVWVEGQLGNYLSLREHQAFFETTVRDLKRLEEHDLQQNKQMEKMIGEKASRESVETTNKRIDQLYNLINELRREVSRNHRSDNDGNGGKGIKNGG